MNTSVGYGKSANVIKQYVLFRTLLATKCNVNEYCILKDYSLIVHTNKFLAYGNPGAHDNGHVKTNSF